MVESQRSMAVTITFNGRTITGSYRLSRNILIVTSDFGRKGAHIAGFHQYPEGLARIMLRELALEGVAPKRRAP